MELLILGVLGVVLIALGFLVMRDARRPVAEPSRCFASCDAQPCKSQPCEGEPCKAAPCHAELVRPVVDLSGLERRLGELALGLDAGMARVTSLAADELRRDREQHAELLAALRADVRQMVDREAETVIGLAEMCSDLGYSADTAHDVALRQVRKERQRVLRDKIARARAARLAARGQ
jgi:hypothetical protein